MKIVALAGGVGGAKLAHGLAQILSPEELTIIVNSGAYIAEIVRGAFISVPRGLKEAGLALGMALLALIAGNAHQQRRVPVQLLARASTRRA